MFNDSVGRRDDPNESTGRHEGYNTLSALFPLASLDIDLLLRRERFVVGPTAILC